MIRLGGTLTPYTAEHVFLILFFTLRCITMLTTTTTTTMTIVIIIITLCARRGGGDGDVGGAHAPSGECPYARRRTSCVSKQTARRRRSPRRRRRAYYTIRGTARGRHDHREFVRRVSVCVCVRVCVYECAFSIFFSSRECSRRPQVCRGKVGLLLFFIRRENIVRTGPCSFFSFENNNYSSSSLYTYIKSSARLSLYVFWVYAFAPSAKESERIFWYGLSEAAATEEE